VVGLRRGQVHLIDAAVALMLVLAMLSLGFSELKQRAFALEDSRTETRRQLRLITQSDECILNPKSNCSGDMIARVRVHP